MFNSVGFGAAEDGKENGSNRFLRNLICVCLPVSFAVAFDLAIEVTFVTENGRDDLLVDGVDGLLVRDIGVLFAGGVGVFPNGFLVLSNNGVDALPVDRFAVLLVDWPGAMLG